MPTAKLCTYSWINLNSHWIRGDPAYIYKRTRLIWCKNTPGSYEKEISTQQKVHSIKGLLMQLSGRARGHQHRSLQSHTESISWLSHHLIRKKGLDHRSHIGNKGPRGLGRWLHSLRGLAFTDTPISPIISRDKKERNGERCLEVHLLLPFVQKKRFEFYVNGSFCTCFPSSSTSISILLAKRFSFSEEIL